jgi:hypothetical protein
MEEEEEESLFGLKCLSYGGSKEDKERYSSAIDELAHRISAGIEDTLSQDRPEYWDNDADLPLWDLEHSYEMNDVLILGLAQTKRAILFEDIEEFSRIHPVEHKLLKNIRFLKLRYGGIYSLEDCINLQSLDISETDVQTEGIEYIVKKLKKLKKLRMCNVHDVHSFSMLSELENLEYLDLWRNSISEEDLIALSTLKNLKELHLSPELLDSDEVVGRLDALFPNTKIVFA